MSEKTRAAVKEKFETEEYPIHIVGRHIAITEPMKSYAIEKLSKVERFGGRVLSATITMDVQKMLHTVDMIIDVDNTKIKVSASSDNMYASIDLAIARLTGKVRRFKDRLRNHHAKGISEIELNVNVIEAGPNDDINDQIEEEMLKKVEADLKPHSVVSTEKKLLKMLSQQEAIMKMELSEDVFMIYLSEEDHKLKVIYRREDNHYGIIEIQK